MRSIRASRAQDGDRVVEIWRNAVDATHDFLSAHDRIEIERMVRDFLPSAPLIVATDDADRPLGFMLLADGHLEALFVDPGHHGGGVGAELVRHGLALHPSMTTDVNEQNQRALGFYLHLGFRPTGRSDVDGQGRPYPLIHLRREG